MLVLVCACMPNHFSCVLLFLTPWTVAHQAPLSFGLSRQEYWSGLPHPPPGESSPPRDRTLVSHVSLCVCECVCPGQRENLKQKFVRTMAMEDIYFSCMLNKIISSKKDCRLLKIKLLCFIKSYIPQVFNMTFVKA